MTKEEEKNVESKTDTCSVDELVSKVTDLKLEKQDAQQEKEKARKEAPEALRKVAELIETGKCKKIIVLSGAGISVAAGIPDFRTPGTGLYDNLQKYNLPYPEAVFDVNFYRNNPQPFVSLAKEIWPGIKHSPTLTHSFISLLAQKKLLLRTYTQNIDGLEFLAGIPSDAIVECHGHFRTASCVGRRCGLQANADDVLDSIVNKGETPVCSKCGSYVKPDIVFFGEGLPNRFHQLLKKDLQQADLLLILGTSLQVAPVSMIPDMMNKKCPRVLLNRERVGNLDLRTKNGRDLFHGADCDDSIKILSQVLGWEEELLSLNEETKVGKQTNSNKKE